MANARVAAAIKRAAKIVGSQAALARALGLQPVTVANWITSDPKRHRPVPPAKCVAIEALTKGRVTRKQLRPHDYASLWPDLAEAAQQS